MTTFQYLAAAILGRPDHRQPSPLQPFDRDLQMWVAACLFVGLEDTYQLLHGEMTPEQAEQFYRSAWTLGTTPQVTEDQWPATRADFDIYWKTPVCTSRSTMGLLPAGADVAAYGLTALMWPATRRKFRIALGLMRSAAAHGVRRVGLKPRGSAR